MKTTDIIKFSVLLFTITMVFSCRDVKDSDHFSGEIVEFSDLADMIEIQPRTIELDGVYDGLIAVYDSLVFFWSHKYRDAWYSVFNLNNNQHLGFFIPSGEGPNEVLRVVPITQFFTENNELKTLLYAFSDNKLVTWNITKSLEQNETIYDTIIPYNWQTEKHIIPFKDMFYAGEDSLFVYRHPAETDEEPTLPLIELRTISSNERIDQISVFKNSIANKESMVYTNDFFFTDNSYKPDGTKVVQTMSRLGQINIIDLKSHQVKGYRMKNTDDFSIFYGTMEGSKYYYYRVASNNDYIFALWLGKSLDILPEIYEPDIIHVFDWEGNFIKKIKLAVPIREMWLDQVNNLLYGYNEVEEKLYCYNINEIGL